MMKNMQGEVEVIFCYAVCAEQSHAVFIVQLVEFLMRRNNFLVQNFCAILREFDRVMHKYDFQTVHR